MAGAIGLSGIHNVTGVCDLCGVKCDPNNEDLNALDCTYKECPSMVYHQSCLEKYLKSIRLEKYTDYWYPPNRLACFDRNRKTGFKCPRGCGKGTRFSEACRGKVDKSHPIHVRHEQITKPKLERQNSKKDVEFQTKKQPSLKTPNLADLNLMKALPLKSEEQNSEWKVSLKRSKSLDKTQRQLTQQQQHCLAISSPSTDGNVLRSGRSRRSTGSFSLTSSSKRGKSQRRAPVPEIGSKSPVESVRSHLEATTRSCELEESSDNSSQRPSIISCESPDLALNPTSLLPSLQEGSNLGGSHDQDKLLTDKCKQCLIEWKSTMLIKQLYRMGFEMWRASSAVQIFGSNTEEAIQWLLENEGLSHDQVNAMLWHQPSAQINVEFEIRTILHICQKYSVDEAILQGAVVRFEGDLNSAVQSLLGNRADEYCFPDFDLSLGIVQSESPYICEINSTNRDEEATLPEALSDELILGCVLGSALEDYKRGDADFTDLVNKNLSFYDHVQISGGISSPLSSSLVHSQSANQVSASNVQQQYPPPYGFEVYGLDHSRSYRSVSGEISSMNDHQYLGSTSIGDPAMTTTTPMELRHFIGDILE
eukprot:g2991.t1